MVDGLLSRVISEVPINGSTFTVASIKPLSFKRIRGIIRMSARVAGIKNISACFAGDRKKSSSWHIGLYDRVLTEDEKSSIERSMDHYRKTLELGTSEVFFRWDVNNASRYIRQHSEVVELVQIC